MTDKDARKSPQHSALHGPEHGADSGANREIQATEARERKRVHHEPVRSVAKEGLSNSPIPDTGSTIGGWMIALLWLMALAAATYFAQLWFDNRDSARAGVVVSSNGAQSFKVTSDRFGQFAVTGFANGQKVNFLIDTGASGISIPQGIADQLGLTRGRAFQVNTANGITTVYATVIDSLVVGPHRQNQVRAHINPSMDGELALLGMSFLRYYELVHRDGILMINPQ